MKQIILTKNKVAFVDDEVFEEINSFKWYAAKRGDRFYACRNVNVNGIKNIVYMHRQILNLSNRKILADHKDRDGLNNTKENLRECTSLENSRNREGLNKTSKYKGVHFHKLTNKWRAMIMINDKSKHLGLFVNEVDAAKKYDSIAKEVFGEFAKLNF